jgi:hypothetical protein
MVTNIEKLTAPEFNRGAVKFHIDKMPALAAWTLLDKTRRELGKGSVGNMEYVIEFETIEPDYTAASF